MSGIAAAISAGAAVVSGGYKFYEGYQQKKQAEQIAKNNPFIPQTMPGQVSQSTQLAAQNYTNGMPGMVAAQQGIKQNAANAQSFATKGASSGGDILDVANKINTNTQNSEQQLSLQAANYKANALGGYQQALNTEAGWQDKLYQNNTLQPYLRAANTAASMYGAGAQNEAGGLDTAFQGLTAAGSEYGNMKMENKKIKGLESLQRNPYIDSPINTNQLLSLSALLS